MSISSLAAAVMILPMIPPITAMAGTTVSSTRERSQFWRRGNVQTEKLPGPVATWLASTYLHLCERVDEPSDAGRYETEEHPSLQSCDRVRSMHCDGVDCWPPFPPCRPASCSDPPSSCWQSRPWLSRRTMTSPCTLNHSGTEISFPMQECNDWEDNW